MENNANSRREFLKIAALGVAGASLGMPRATLANLGQAELTLLVSSSEEIIKLGVASYSLRNFDRSATIKMVKEIGAKYIAIKSVHLPMEYTRDELAAGRQEFEDAGLEIVAGGVIALREDDDEHIQHRFEYARICGMPVMVIAPTPETLPRIERFVKDYDIKVAIHNHGPEDRYFPSPQDAMEYIKDMDPRIGICNDLGHTARTGIDIIESLKVSGDRLFDIHLKDLKDMSDNNTQCIIGEGAMPVADIFHQLVKMNYQGVVNLEYEIEADDPLAGMKQSFAYMQGVVDGIA